MLLIRGTAGRALVSIRSPHKSKGRPLLLLSGLLGHLFQSAPLTKARGDRVKRKRRTPEQSFNPLPSQKQGETRPAQPSPTMRRVSIRSPHKSKGRLVSLCCAWAARGGFNPLPSQKQGETREARPTHYLPVLFQSAPLTKARGDYVFRASPLSYPRFNPLPSQKQGETQNVRGLRTPGARFQSAPLTKARGDVKVFLSNAPQS